MGQSCDCGMVTPSLTWCSVFQLEVGSIDSLFLLSGISSKVPPIESWESLTFKVSGAFWRVPPTSYFLRFSVSILSAGPQGFSPFPSPNTRSGTPLPPTLPHGSRWTYGSQKTSLKSISLFTMKVPGIQLSSLGLAAGNFTHWAISLTYSMVSDPGCKLN
jgi:hypothetical protein